MADYVDPTIAQWQAEKHEIGMVEFLPSEIVADCFPFYELPPNATFLGLMDANLKA